jgi:hypothetical protein
MGRDYVTVQNSPGQHGIFPWSGPASRSEYGTAAVWLRGPQAGERQGHEGVSGQRW